MSELQGARRTAFKNAALGTVAFSALVLASSGAWAQNCTAQFTTNGVPGAPPAGFAEVGGLAASTAGSIVGAIANVNTAFLAQQGSAFVSAPGNAPPGSPGGGVWVRGVGGEVTVKSTSSTNLLGTVPGFPGGHTDAGVINCANREKETFAGVQVGQDISRLNIDGLNVHLGTTAGYLESRARELAGLGQFRTNFEVPFIGTYLVATKGGFFFDAMLRGEFYNIDLDNPGFQLFNQPFSGRGISISANAGYNIPLQNNWFIEPSAGFIWSRTTIDSFNAVGLAPPIAGNNISGTFTLDDIKGEIGRATVRVGTSFTSGNLALQPFGSVSVFHEFAGDVGSNYTTCANCVFFGAFPATITAQTATSRLGTWGQGSLGVAGQVLNTGWVGFVRGDYRHGSNIDGWTGNAGIRYMFLPEVAAAPVMPLKAKALPVAAAVPVNWTGFYIGGFFGGVYGKTNFDFVGDGGTNPRIAGGLGGGQAGYNYQINQWVLGIEGDIGATNAHGAKTCGAATGLNAFGVPVAFSPYFMTCSNDLDWIATLAGRIGVTWDRTLFYVKGGAAWTEDNLAAACILGPNNNPANGRACFNQAGVLVNSITASGRRTGWLLGWGTEFALTRNWSAKAEYNYIGFGDRTTLGSDGTTLITDRTRISEVKVGVNYRFGASPLAPVVARY